MRYLLPAAALLLAALHPATPAAAEGERFCDLTAPYDAGNPFARILDGRQRQAVVYEDRRLLAFLPIAWASPGHVLIIPKRQVRSLLDMRPGEMAAALDLARRIGLVQVRALGATGFQIQQNNGTRQTVCHAHFHVIPSYGGKPYGKADAKDSPTPAEQEAMAARLRAGLKRVR